jgi:arylsulfatase A-like enzyme
VEQVGYYTDLIAEHATHYLAERGKKREQPFLLSLHFTAPHWPWEGPKDTEVSKALKDFMHFDGGSQATYAEMVRSLDAAVGRVLHALGVAGLSESTFVVFTSDNGGERFSQTWLSADRRPSSWKEEFESPRSRASRSDSRPGR